ncbi:MAG TPA: DUF2267 domain-containing protein [Micromonosporaceae bacterium]|nr:DUF2267 domain-containing protein [Micromonosporaceae bacterium]
MKYESFLATVSQRASISSQQADECTRVVLETLAERLTGGEALDLAAQLPKPMQAALRPRTENAQRFGAQEFIRRVAGCTGANERQAKKIVRSVFDTLREAVSSGEFDDLLAQLPRDFRGVVDLSRTPVDVSRLR